MRQLLLISLALLCLASAFPIGDDETLNQLPEADKVLIRNMVLRYAAMSADLITKINHPIFGVVKSILSCKKADQRMLDDLQNWMNRVKADEGISLEEVDKSGLKNIFKTYIDPEQRESRNRLNLWTDGQFDVIMSKFFQTLKDSQDAFIEVLRTTISSLSEATKMSYSNLIAKFNSDDENDIKSAASILFSELTDRADMSKIDPQLEEYRTKFQEKLKISFE